ncbi:SDR family NAD(P)-dependent oxidoreductase, partial [Streptomyces sp. NPDC058953]|uniref:SDR family NAD(P)-dependent oxidoreductase n=1 Tax=Streptomyces sp. NPDC058953 TaxID=3346676 RepID=UPI0036B80010
LRALALGNCTGTLNVVKQIVPPGTTGEDVTGAFTLHTRPYGTEDDEPWQLCATGELSTDVPDGTNHPGVPETGEPLDARECYAALADAGYVYGPAFRGITALERGDEGFSAQVRLPDGLDAEGYGIHPALLDAALQPLLLRAGDGVRLPFSLSGITLHATGATALRVRVRAIGTDAWSVAAYDPAGAPVVTVGSVTTRPYRPAVEQRHPAVHRDLLRLVWAPGTDPVPAETADDALCWSAPDGAGDAFTRTRELLHRGLSFLREWLTDPAHEAARLVVVTRRAVATHPGEPVDPAGAALWGLARSAQSEHPGRIVLLDHDGPAADGPPPEALRAALAATVPQVAWRTGVPYLPALRPGTPEGGPGGPPPGNDWHLDTTSTSGTGTVDDLVYRTAPEREPVGRQVRLRTRAAGVNFYDVAVCLGLLDDHEGLGVEAVGTVTDIGPDVVRLRPGDRVMGLVPHAFAPTGVADERLLIPVPEGWSDGEAAAATAAYGTAYHALVTLADVRPGQRVLIHAGAGGVGHAAIRLAQHLGAEVYATASPAKWPVLEGLGVRVGRIAGSRSLDFEDAFREATAGAGMDVVLNALAGEFTDASLRLLPAGGHFVEMGKTDLRDPAEVAAAHPGVDYRAFSLTALDIPVLEATLGALGELFASGALPPLPTTGYDIREAHEAFRLMTSARHTGKLALTLPVPIDPGGTVLITGGTGTLAGLAARQLAARYPGIRLLLVSRQGAASPGAAALTAELAEDGADVVVVARDLTEPGAVRELVEGIGTERPLTAVLHTAVQLADAPVTALTPERMDHVLDVKAGVAWELHRATADHDLSAFVLYSSVAGVFGTTGQGNYAAANAFLDALAHHRHLGGLPATSLAWGLWEPDSAGTRLTDVDRARLERTGLAPITAERGAALLDHALARGVAALVPAPLTRAVRTGRSDPIHPLLRYLGRPARRTAGAPEPRKGDDTLAARLAALPPERRSGEVLTLLRGHAATVLGRPSPHDIAPEATFKALGFDSLTALELRNALTRSAGVRLSPTLVFDHPTPKELSAHLVSVLVPQPPHDARTPYSNGGSAVPDRFDSASPDELVDLAMEEE